MIPARSVVMILDYKKASENATTGVFLESLSKKAESIIIAEEQAKSIVLTEQKGKWTVYYSPISCATLAKRAGRFFIE